MERLYSPSAAPISNMRLTHFFQIIPQIGFDSAPADLLAWLLVTHIRATQSVGVKEVIASVEEIK